MRKEKSSPMDKQQNRIPTTTTPTRFGISDELWAALQPLLPIHINTHRTGGGRPRVPDRDCANAIFYVLSTGCHWQALDQTDLCGHWAARDRFQEWLNAGVFLKLCQTGLEQFAELHQINWDLLSIDPATTTAPSASEKTSPNPINHNKPNIKHACHHCHHRYLTQAMQQVSLQNGEYHPWTPDRAAYFRRCRLKHPMLIWLCNTCASTIPTDPHQRASW